MTETIYKEETGEFVKGIEPLVLTTLDFEAMKFDGADAIADGLTQSEGVAFRVGRPKKLPHA